MRHAGPSRTARTLLGAALGVGGLLAAGSIATAVLGTIFARKVIIPPTSRPDDVRILRVEGDAVVLSRTMDSLTPGSYSLWFSADIGHARVGEIRAVDDHTVVRQLLGVDFGDLGSARRGRLSGWFFLSPADLGVPYHDVEVATPVGAAPAWLVPSAETTAGAGSANTGSAGSGSAGTGSADTGSAGTDWAIMVHGRAVTRSECLRAVRVFREAGYTSLLVSYRNDGIAPDSDDRRYALGDQEWQDVSAAIGYALDHGAQRVVLMGWSMGGATSLQTLTRSPLREAIRGVVLESPVVDWITALHFQGLVNRLPALVQWLTLQLLTRRWGRWVTGQRQSIDLARLDIVARANELQVPILLLHSVDDGYIPATASKALAQARPDIVTYEEFTVARHTKLWNYDHDRWDRAIRRWLAALH